MNILQNFAQHEVHNIRLWRLRYVPASPNNIYEANIFTLP